MSDPFDLQRFVTAQAAVYDIALGELRSGRKRSHWMWFIFPQLRGLGSSAMAERYGIASLDEARAYLDHSVLGPRLIACTEAVLAVKNRSLEAIFGGIDAVKFGSSMTLFTIAAKPGGSPVFGAAIEQCCDGVMDERSVGIVGGD